MSLTAIVRALVSAGATPEMIAAAVEAAELEHERVEREKAAAAEQAKKHRRELGAERQRRFRAARNERNASRIVTERDERYAAPLDGPLSPAPLSPLNPPDLASLGDTPGATERESVEPVTAPKPRTTRSPAAPTEHPDFATFWQAYPRRLGTNSRAGAAARFGALAKSGVDPGAMIAGARRYARQCAARGVIGTEFVQQATTWLNPKNRAWEEAYELPDQQQQPQRRDDGRRPAVSGNPLLAACRDRLSRLGDGGRVPDPAPGSAGRDPFGDPSPHVFDRGEPVRGDVRSGDRRRGGEALDDATSWR